MPGTVGVRGGARGRGQLSQNISNSIQFEGWGAAIRQRVTNNLCSSQRQRIEHDFEADLLAQMEIYLADDGGFFLCSWGSW